MKTIQLETRKLQQVQTDIRMRSHRLLRLEDNKSVNRLAASCKLSVAKLVRLSGICLIHTRRLIVALDDVVANFSLKIFRPQKSHRKSYLESSLFETAFLRLHLYDRSSTS